MNYYAIGIGGTGAKCIEALTHLSAAGMIPDGELYSMFVDPDKANGSLERAQITLQQYVDCEKRLALGSTDFLKTRVVRPDPDVWSPFGDEARPRLGSFFKYSDLEVEQPAAAHLFDVLYSRSEKETRLDMGFRGHPSIGAAVMAKTVKLGEVEPWQTFRKQMAIDAGGGAGARIFLFGSIFGGTGAAGFPTIARLMHNELESMGGAEHIKIGGALVLPYFSFIPEGDEDELKANCENFLMDTQVALKYYHQERKTNIYDSVYLFGDECLSPVKYSIGAKTQRNEPHFIELYASLAAIDFFKGGETQENQYFMLARHQENHLGWNDLPDGNGGNTVKEKIEQLARFAFAYLGAYLPALEEIRTGGRSYRFPWFVNFFEREKINIADNSTQELLGHVKAFCESYLKWLIHVQTSAKDEHIELINHNAFDGLNFRLEYFDNLTLPMGKGNLHALNKLWESMCGVKVSDPGANGIGKFIHALYEQCAK